MPRPAIPNNERRTALSAYLNQSERDALEALAARWECSRNEAIVRAILSACTNTKARR